MKPNYCGLLLLVLGLVMGFAVGSGALDKPAQAQERGGDIAREKLLAGREKKIAGLEKRLADLEKEIPQGSKSPRMGSPKPIISCTATL